MRALVEPNPSQANPQGFQGTRVKGQISPLIPKSSPLLLRFTFHASRLTFHVSRFILPLLLACLLSLRLWPPPARADDLLSFASPIYLLNSSGTRSVAIGDLNGDGTLDLVLGGRYQQRSRVYLNEGGGSFTPPIELPDNYYTTSVAIGDLNGDGALDLVLGKYYQPSQVYLNEGEGSFAPPIDLPGSDDANSVAIGDLNGDGALDLVLGNSGQPSQVYLNEGGGSFAPPIDLPDSDRTSSVAIGDLNGDGTLDLVLGKYYQPSQVYLNEGEGSFAPPIDLPSSDRTSSVAIGDLNGDGALDLVLGDHPEYNDNRPSQVYLNEGEGSFAPPIDLPDSDVNSVAIGDLNGDGALDLVLGKYLQASQVYLNEGEGGFAPPIDLPGSDDSTSVAIGDLNGDGALDLVLGKFGYYSQVYLNEGGGSFAPPIDLPDSSGTGSVAIGDLNGDGALDLVLGDHIEYNDNRPSQVYLNEGEGSFAPPIDLPDSDDTNSVAIGDLNGDGALDLVLGKYYQPSQVYLNEGEGSFAPPIDLLGSDDANSVAIGDLNGDGALDLVLGKFGYYSQVYLNEGEGSFAPPIDLPDSDDTNSVALGDLNGDGALDLVLGNSRQHSQVYLNEGEGSFAPPIDLSDNTYTASIAIGDLNGDGALDLVLGNPGQHSQVYLNEGEGSFAPPIDLPNSFGTTSVAIGDLNGDGALDLVLSNLDQSKVYLNEGGGSFAPPLDLPDNYYTSSVAIGDLNGDGALDLVLGNYEQPSQVYLTQQANLIRLPNNPPAVAVTRPGSTGNANFFSTAEILSSLTIPFTYTLFDRESDPVGHMAAYYSLDGGGQWRPVIPTQTITHHLTTSPYPTPTLANTYVFTWDTFASGVFGQSDNVVLRLVAYPQPVYTGIPNTYQYTHTVAGPYQRPYAAATTFPFRVQGTQVQVLSGTQGISNAVVYHLPRDQSSGGLAMGHSITAPFRTNQQGYLPGRGQIGLSDQLLALVPAPLPAGITESYSDTLHLYYTNGTPTEIGVNTHEVVAAGVQRLTVSAANPLLLFDLDISLEWDISKDETFLVQLRQNLIQTSQALYDWTNGQVALGRATVYQAKEYWQKADVRIFASNRVRPIANRGGIVRDTTVLNLTGSEPLTFTQGEIRMGATWNRYGSPEPIAQDWPRVLAHELGHYALFLEDTYLKVDENGLLVPSDPATCDGTAMYDPYQDATSELQFEMTGCDSLAELPDWQLLKAVYPALHPPPPVNGGPLQMPFAFTQVEVKAAPSQPRPLLDDFYVESDDSLADGRVYLFQHAPTLAEERLIDLGRPVLNSVTARGARERDEVCVFAETVFGCTVLSNSRAAVIEGQPYPSDWQPDIVLTPVSSTTLDILMTGVSGSLSATFYPQGEAPQQATLTPGVTARIHLEQPAVELVVEIKGEQANQQRLVTGYSVGAGPGRTRGHGGPGRTRGHGGPFASGDGGLILYPPLELPEEAFIALQTATRLPGLPAGVTAIGRAYHLRPSAGVTNFEQGSLTFQYLELDVLLAGEEEERLAGQGWQEGRALNGPALEALSVKERNLAIYYHDGTTWRPLPTTVDTRQNFASAATPGPGLYGLAIAPGPILPYDLYLPVMLK